MTHKRAVRLPKVAGQSAPRTKLQLQADVRALEDRIMHALLLLNACKPSWSNDWNGKNIAEAVKVLSVGAADAFKRP